MYKIEPHLHTRQVSKCGWLDAEELARLYHEAGYHAIAVTDHYNPDTWVYMGIDPKDPADVMPRFTEGYQRLAEAAAAYNMTVYLGAELRFYENDNDYLFYGFDPAMLAHPHEIMSMGAVPFSDIARKSGAVFIQAHPFRKTCVPLAPCFLDGIEVYNANPRHMHHNHNDLAQALADAQGPGFIQTAGSDCHRLEDVGLSGIQSRILPPNATAFATLLRSGSFERIIPAQDGNPDR